MTERATVTYRIDGTTLHKVITGTRLSVQMRKRCTVVRVLRLSGDRPVEVHLFKKAQYIHLELDVPD